MRHALWPLSLALGFCLAACNASQPAPPPMARPGGAAEALEAGDYQRAAELYRRALAAEPGNLGLHYGLGVAASHLRLKDETAREFRWVLAQAPPASEEARVARGWLMNAGLLPRKSTLSPAEVEERVDGGDASLEGHAVFGEAGKPPQPMRRFQLFLMGLQDSAAKGQRHHLRTDEDGRYRFPKLVAGAYMLTNRLAGQPVWRLRVEVKPGESRQLELTPANSTATLDDFPETR